MGCGCKKKKPVVAKPANVSSTTQSSNQSNNSGN